MLVLSKLICRRLIDTMQYDLENNRVEIVMLRTYNFDTNICDKLLKFIKLLLESVSKRTVSYIK